jgi:hypothetical protein
MLEPCLVVAAELVLARVCTSALGPFKRRVGRDLGNVQRAAQLSKS